MRRKAFLVLVIALSCWVGAIVCAQDAKDSPKPTSTDLKAEVQPTSDDNDRVLPGQESTLSLEAVDITTNPTRWSSRLEQRLKSARNPNTSSGIPHLPQRQRLSTIPPLSGSTETSNPVRESVPADSLKNTADTPVQDSFIEQENTPETTTGLNVLELTNEIEPEPPLQVTIAPEPMPSQPDVKSLLPIEEPTTNPILSLAPFEVDSNPNVQEQETGIFSNPDFIPIQTVPTGKSNPPLGGPFNNAPKAPTGTSKTPTGTSTVDNGEKSNDVLFTSQGPTLSVHTIGPRTIKINEPVAYQVVVDNVGSVSAEGLEIKIRIPSWTDLESSEPSTGRAKHEAGGERDSFIVWTVDYIQPKRSEKLDLRIIPRSSEPFDLAVGWSFRPSQSMAQIEIREPRLEMNLRGPREVLYGETKTFTISISNPGTGNAKNVAINLLPVGPGNDVAGVKRIETLPAGERKDFHVKLTAQQAGALLVRAQAYADGGLRAEASEEVIVRRAKMDVQVEAPRMKYAGTIASYKVRVTNVGDAPAEELAVTAILPPEAEYIAGPDGGHPDASNSRITWRVGILRPGASRVYKFRSSLKSSGTNRVEIVANAKGDLSSFTSAITEVEALADLNLQVHDPQGPIPVGEDSVYEILIQNRGTKAAEGVRVFTFFSEGIEPIMVQGGRAELSPGQVTFQPIKRIEAGKKITLKVTAKATLPGNHIFRTEVECIDPKSNFSAQDTTHFYSTETVEDDPSTASQPERSLETR